MLYNISDIIIDSITKTITTAATATAITAMIPETSIMQHATRPANLDLETAIPRTRPLMTSTDLSLTIDAYNPDLTRRWVTYFSLL